jgi:hypothetical protein
MTEYRDPDPEWEGEEAAALYAAINARQPAAVRMYEAVLHTE